MFNFGLAHNHPDCGAAVRYIGIPIVCSFMFSYVPPSAIKQSCNDTLSKPCLKHCCKNFKCLLKKFCHRSIVNLLCPKTTDKYKPPKPHGAWQRRRSSALARPKGEGRPFLTIDFAFRFGPSVLSTAFPNGQHIIENETMTRRTKPITSHTPVRPFKKKRKYSD